MRNDLYFCGTLIVLGFILGMTVAQLMLIHAHHLY